MLSVFLYFLFSLNVFAICPVCTIGAGATFTIARLIGCSDLVIGILLSAILFSSAKWLGDFLGKKTHNILVYPLSFFLHYFSIYFLYGEIVNYKQYTFLGIDKFLFGTIVGFCTSFLSYKTYLFIKKKNNNKPHFPYQKVFMYILYSVIFAFIFHHLDLKFS